VAGFGSLGATGRCFLGGKIFIIYLLLLFINFIMITGSIIFFLQTAPTNKETQRKT
jgi:hypothetical protein